MLSDGTWTYSWKYGRQLASMTNGTTTWNYTYNNDGIRSKRTDGTTTYTYYYNGSNLRYLDINGTKLYFVLDATGQPVEVSYVPAGTTKTQVYYFVMNLQGDVTAILNTSGSSVVQYTYDAWGNILSITGSMASTLGVQNPFRYRGYVYDTETGLYYCQSRYYDPALGRFLNADALASTGQGILGNNMFAYCNNNPIQYVDDSGTAATLVQPLGNGISQKEIIKEVIKKLLEPIHLTSSTGLTASGSLTGFWGGSVQGGCSFDAQGNAAIQGAYAGGLTGGSAGLMIGGYNTITNAPNIFKLEGEGCQIGGSATILLSGIPFVIGVDVNLIPDSNAGKMYFGITRTFGVAILGAGGEGHVEWGSTGTLPGSEINHIDVIIDIFDRR